MQSRTPSHSAKARLFTLFEVIFWLFLLFVFVVAAWIRIQMWRTSNNISLLLTGNSELVENLAGYQQFAEYYGAKMSLVADTVRPINEALDHLGGTSDNGIVFQTIEFFAPRASKVIQISKQGMDETVELKEELDALINLSELAPALQRLNIKYDRLEAQKVSSVISMNLERLENFKSHVSAVDAITRDVNDAVQSLNRASESIQHALNLYPDSWVIRLFDSIASAANQFDTFSSRTTTYKTRLAADKFTLQSLESAITQSELNFQRIDKTRVVPLANFVNRYILILLPLLVLVCLLRRQDFAGIFAPKSDELTSLTELDRRMLESLGNRLTPHTQQFRMIQLIEQKKRSQLRKAERSELRNLIEDFERTVLQRARALAILAYRGYENVQNRQSTTPPQTD